MLSLLNSRRSLSLFHIHETVFTSYIVRSELRTISTFKIRLNLEVFSRENFGAAEEAMGLVLS